MSYYNKLSVELLGDRNQVEVLRFLYRNRPNRFSQRQMSNALNIPPATISRTCKKIEVLNIVVHNNIGKSILYHFDGESYIAKRILVPVFENEENFFCDLIKDIMSTLNRELAKCIKEIVLFGSILRDEDTPASDIDLAIVIKSATALTRTTTLMHNRIEEIEKHFIHESVKRDIPLDIHMFLEGEKRKNKKGISLTKVREEGTVIWRRPNENSSKRRL